MPRILLSDNSMVDLPMSRVAILHAKLDSAPTQADADSLVADLAEELTATLEIDPNRDCRSFLGEISQTLGLMKPVAKDVFIARIQTCISCEHSRQIDVPKVSMPIIQCSNCGCLMNAKARLASGTCPIGKF